MVKSAKYYTSDETGIPENKLELTYGMGPRIFMSKEWVLNFIDILVLKEPVRSITLNPKSEFMERINSLPDIEKYSLKKINKELGEPEIYG